MKRVRGRPATIPWKVCLLALLLVLISSPSGCQAMRRRRQDNKHVPTPRDDDYYGILGLSKGASPKEIKAAYRTLALKYHPDKVEEEDKEKSEDMFVKISQAYAVLGDEKKREIFDQYGKNGLDAHEKGQDPRAAGFGGFGGGGSTGFGGGGSTGFGGGGANFDAFNMFDSMFGSGGGGANFNFGGAGGGFGGGGQQQQPEHPELFPREESKVARLGKPKFPDQKSKHIWLIMFYKNDNPDSLQVATAYERLAEKPHLPYKVGAVDCGKSERETMFCESKGVEAFPEFAVVLEGGLKTLSLDTSPKSVTAKDLHERCMDQMPQHLIHNINSLAQMENKMLQQGKRPAVLLLTDKYETSSMYYSIVYQFRKEYDFGESRAKNLALAQSFQVKKYPQLMAFVPAEMAEEKYNDIYGIIRYTGAVKKEEIAKWLEGVKRKIADTSNSETASQRQRRKSKDEL